MKTVSIVYPDKFKSVYEPLSQAFQDIFQQLGFKVAINHILKHNVDIELVLCPLFYGTFQRTRSTHYILFQMEQFPNQYAKTKWQQDKWNRTKILLPYYDSIWDTYKEHLGLYSGLKQSCKLFQLGYHSIFDKYQKLPKEYNVSFFGTPNERRNKILTGLDEFNVKFERKIEGVQRDTLINQTKISLNLHYSESPLFESLRVLLYLMCSKAFVITEPFVGEPDFIHKKHLVISQNLSEDIRYYLSNKQEMVDIANAGYEYLKTVRTLQSSVEQCLEGIK